MTLLGFAFGLSLALNVALLTFAVWQHTIIKVAADELGVKL